MSYSKNVVRHDKNKNEYTRKAYEYMKMLYLKWFPQKRYYAKDLRYFGDRKPILDIGCGEGLFLEAAPDRIIGLDVNPEMVYQCRLKGLKCIEGSCLEIPFEDNSVEGIYCSHVIEHLRWEEALKLVEEIDRVLCSGGVIVIKTLFPSKHFYNDPTHVKPYTPAAILALFGVTESKQKSYTTTIRNYEYITIKWDRALLFQPILPPSVNTSKQCLRLILKGASVILAQFGIRRIKRDGYTLVMKKK